MACEDSIFADRAPGARNLPDGYAIVKTVRFTSCSGSSPNASDGSPKPQEQLACNPRRGAMVQPAFHMGSGRIALMNRGPPASGRWAGARYTGGVGGQAACASSGVPTVPTAGGLVGFSA